MFPVYMTLVVLSPLFVALIVSYAPQFAIDIRADRKAEKLRVKDIDWTFSVMLNEVRNAPTTDIHHSMYRSDDESLLRSYPDPTRSSGRANHRAGVADRVPRSVQASTGRRASVPGLHRSKHN